MDRLHNQMNSVSKQWCIKMYARMFLLLSLIFYHFYVTKHLHRIYLCRDCKFMKNAAMQLGICTCFWKCLHGDKFWKNLVDICKYNVHVPCKICKYFYLLVNRIYVPVLYGIWNVYTCMYMMLWRYIQIKSAVQTYFD